MTSMSFKGVTAASLGVVVLDYPPIIKPKARVKTVTVPGRSGTLVLHDPETVYEPVEKTVKCRMLSSASQVAVAAWLTGSGALIFGNEPLYQYTARVVEEVSFDKIMPNYDDRVFEVAFVCQPWKELAVPGADITLTTSPKNIGVVDTVVVEPDETEFLSHIGLVASWIAGKNSLVWQNSATHALKRLVDLSDMDAIVWEDIQTADLMTINKQSTLDSLPLIQIAGVGAVSINIGSYSFTLSGIESGIPVLVDCDAMTVTNSNQSVSYIANMTGQFPRLVPGGNVVTWSGTVSSIVIRPRYRWL